MDITIEIVRSASRLGEIGAAWQALWTRCGADIFQGHGWLHAWASGEASEALRIGIAWRDETLVAAFPCAIRRQHGLRQLEWAAQTASDYCDAMVDPAEPPLPVLISLWQAIRAAGGFDLIRLRQVRPDARVRRLLDADIAESGHLRQDLDEVPCMRIDRQWADGRTFFRDLTKKQRNNHTRGKRILGELAGEVVFRIHDPSEPLSPVLDRILELKRAWLRIHDPASSMLGSGAATHRAMLEAAWRSGIMTVFLLEAGDRLAAASLNFVYEGKMQAYLTSYDPAFERASPGTILIVEYAMWAFDHGIESVDLMRGSEAFKTRMTNAVTMLNGYAGACTLPGHAALLLRDLRSRWRRTGTQQRDDGREPDT
ncbi:MAG: GNAT family N-acetyltransferase, partial [Acetobacteraceae bacterium]